MPLPKNMVQAFYIESEVPDYRGNPSIEALPPIMKKGQVKKGLIGNVKFNPNDIYSVIVGISSENQLSPSVLELLSV